MTNRTRGFTLIEILVTIAITSIVSSFILMVMDPGRRLAEARNGQRRANVKNISDAIYHYQIDTRGVTIPGIDSQMRQIGTAVTGCAIPCFFGEEASVATVFVDDTQAEFDGGIYANTQWNAGALWLTSQPSGTYTSRSFNAGVSTPWTVLAWTPRAPYGKPLPNNGQTEIGYDSAPASMDGNGSLWHLDETSGRIMDDSGNAKSSSVENALVYAVPGVYGTGVRFGGSSHVDFPSVFSHSAPAADIDELTVELWMRSTVNPVSAGVMAWQGWGGTFVLQVNAAGEIGFVIKQTRSNCGNYDGTWIGANSSPVRYTDGSWHHVAGRYHRGENTAALYVDGVLKSSSALDPNECLSDPPTTHPPILGAASQYPNNRVNFFTGDLDEVALYSRALSVDEIRERYERGVRDVRAQVRSCQDAQCDTGTFVGPDGTDTDFYDEEDNSTLSPPSISMTNLIDGRYFQYRLTLFTNTSVPAPALERVSISNSATGEATLPEQCVDIAPFLARYFPHMPIDPSSGVAERTGYAVGLTAEDTLVVRACSAEQGERIEAR